MGPFQSCTYLPPGPVCLYIWPSLLAFTFTFWTIIIIMMLPSETDSQLAKYSASYWVNTCRPIFFSKLLHVFQFNASCLKCNVENVQYLWSSGICKNQQLINEGEQEEVQPPKSAASEEQKHTVHYLASFRHTVVSL